MPQNPLQAYLNAIEQRKPIAPNQALLEFIQAGPGSTPSRGFANVGITVEPDVGITMAGGKEGYKPPEKFGFGPFLAPPLQDLGDRIRKLGGVFEERDLALLDTTLRDWAKKAVEEQGGGSYFTTPQEWSQIGYLPIRKWGKEGEGYRGDPYGSWLADWAWFIPDEDFRRDLFQKYLSQELARRDGELRFGLHPSLGPLLPKIEGLHEKFQNLPPELREETIGRMERGLSPMTPGSFMDRRFGPIGLREGA